MKNVAVIYNPLKTMAKERAIELATELELRNIRVQLDATKKKQQGFSKIDNKVNLAVVLGGDGSFLSAARFFFEQDIPILGINYGHLGFLSEYGDIDMQDLAARIQEKRYSVETRSVIEAYIEGKEDNIFYAFNEIAVNRSHYSNLLYTDLYIEDNLIHSYRSDGIVVCTPTGSTAYALSAGGAVMDPNIKAFQIVPIAAHSLNSRPLVLSDDEIIVLASKDRLKYFMQADGQDLINMEAGSKLIIKKSSKLLSIVKLNQKDRNFYSILRDKMKWGQLGN